MIRKLLKNKLLLFLIVIFCMSNGYAYLNSSLFINGTSIISANAWEVGLNNLNVTAGSVAAIKEPTLETATTTAFEVKLNNKEDFYEFTVDVVNSGDTDAKLGSLVETTGLTQEQEQYFEHTVTYQNNEPIQVNQLVKKDEFVRLKSKVEYKEEVNIASVPESAKTLKLGFKLNYDLDDGSGIEIKNNGIKVIPIANGSLNDIGTIVTIGTEQFYVIGTEGDNVKLLSMYNLYVGGKYDGNIWIAYGEEATGIQDSTMLGWVIEQNIRNGVVAYSANDFYYNGSIVEEYINSYKQYLERQGVTLTEARALTNTELIGLGCIEEDYSCKNAPNFIYATSFWTKDVWYVICNGNFHYSDDIGRVDSFGVRPVIVIPKNEIMFEEKELIYFTIDGIAYQIDEGMTWREWIESNYNPGNFSIDSYDYIYDNVKDKQLNQCEKADEVINIQTEYITIQASGLECSIF